MQFSRSPELGFKRFPAHFVVKLSQSVFRPMFFHQRDRPVLVYLSDKSVWRGAEHREILVSQTHYCGRTTELLPDYVFV